jgi:osmoprotectant transport system ATP-binding protein
MSAAGRRVIELAGVSKRYGGAVALEPTDLAVEAGTTVVLLGPSGCGKSTLLKMALGLVRPDAGTVRFEGEEVTPDRALAVRRRLGYVVQGGGLFPHLTAAGNAALLPRHLGWEEGRIRARLAELAELAQLPREVLSRFPRELSGGQAQRVSLVRALMLDPQALLLDEPLGALDPITRSELQEDLRAAFRRLGKTVLLVTHDLGEAAFFADRIALLRGGRVVQQGTIADLLRRPAEEFVRRFVSAQRSPLEALREVP